MVKKINLRGIRSPIPAGYLLGRKSPGSGPVELLSPQDIAASPHLKRLISGGNTSFANPTATASDTAVNGTATTAMRSDAAPAIQKASSSVFGIVKVDGTTITSTGGVISAVQSGSATMPLVNGDTPGPSLFSDGNGLPIGVVVPADLRISAYLGRGTHAARPTTPAVAGNATASYYETDTTHLFAWTGSAWSQII